MFRLQPATTRYATAAFPLALLVTALTGCDSPPEAPATPAANVAEFPSDIPIYEGLVKDYVNDSGPLLVLNGNTTDDVAKVVAYYRERLPADAWTEGSDPTQGGGAGVETLVYTKGPAKMVVLVSKDDGKTRVSLQVEGYAGK